MVYSRSRRQFLRMVGMGITAMSVAPFACQEGTSGQPNILFIMADDHTSQAISSYFSRLGPYAHTDNIDRIGKEGMRLTNCFCTNSICVPSRAAILTGQYSHKNGVYTLRDELDPSRENVAKLLQQAGYQTAVIGKWHLKTEPAGFDYWNVLPGQGRYHNPIMTEKDTGRQTYQGYSTDVITDLSLQWLKQRESDKPFCLMTHFKNSHGKWEYPERNASLYTDTRIPEPASLWEDKSHRCPGSRDYGYTISETMLERMTSPDWPTGQLNITGLSRKEAIRATYQKYLKDYLRCVAALNENVGRLLECLDAEGLSRNTVVIYTSDQGLFLGEHNYIDKRWMYEESARMPFLIRYPREIQAGDVNDDLILNVDFAPLFLDYAGQPIPDWMQGRSFRANLQGKTPRDWRTAMYYRYWMHGNRPAHYGIRTQWYKLIFFYGLPLDVNGYDAEPTKPGWELYDLQKDPRELLNVYNDPKYRPVVQELKQELFRLKEQLGDTDEQHPALMQLREKL